SRRRGRPAGPRSSRTPRRTRPGPRRAGRPGGSPPRPPQRPGLDDLPGGDRVGAGDAVGQPPIQLPPLGLGEPGLLDLPGNTFPDRPGQRDPVLDAEAVDAQGLQGRWHGAASPFNSRTTAGYRAGARGETARPPRSMLVVVVALLVAVIVIVVVVIVVHV